MIKLVKAAAILGGAMLLTFSLTSCSQLIKPLDVIGNMSVTSFDQVLSAIPEQVEADEANGGWYLTAPDETARFIWNGKFNSGAGNDIMFEIDAEPFLAAGLEPARLPKSYSFDGNKIIVGTALGDADAKADAGTTPLAAYEQIVEQARDRVSYHASLDHFGIALLEGNTFEWAKDMAENDKDIVFVLDPEPLIEAGVEPNEVEGWVYDKVSSHMGGKTMEINKFLKPFDLK